MKNDALIKHEVLCELKWDTGVDELGIAVEVDAGVACLTGSVKHYGQKCAAQEAAHRVDGVLDVVNDLEVHLPAHLARTDQEIAHMVRKMIDWDVRTPGAVITSTVSNGWVTLEGHVEMQHERDAVEQAIRHLASVRGVNNLISFGRQKGLLEGQYIFDEAVIERGFTR